MTLAMQVLHEPYAHLYVGDYFADTLDLSAHEHCALRLLLLDMGARSGWKCASGKRRRTDKRGMAGYQTGAPAFTAWRAAENCRESQLHTEFRRATASVSRLAHRPQHRHGAG